MTFLITALSGFFIAFNATSGLIPALGFGCVTVIAFYTTLKAYLEIRKGDVVSHQKMMAYSYACCFAAVTLRIWSPFLTISLGSFDIAYPIVAWLSWIPNLMIAHWIIHKRDRYATVRPKTPIPSLIHKNRFTVEKNDKCRYKS